MFATTATVTANRRKNRDENLQWGFTQMPRPVLKAKGLSFRAKGVYCLLCDYARDKDYCFPSQEQLAEDLDTSVDTIQRGLQELKDYGLIAIKRQGQNKPNMYVILPLSKCAHLRIVPPPAKQDTAPMPQRTPHSCGIRVPQECGKKETKSKERIERNADSSESPQKEEVCSVATPDTAQQPPAAYSHPAMTTGNDDTSTPLAHTAEAHADTKAAQQEDKKAEKPFNNTTGSQHKPVQKPFPFIGKPLTQDEIDAKRKVGQNASGISPLSHIIPPEHWQHLEAQARKAPVKPATSHFNVCTKNAPLFIDATIEEFSLLLGDEPGNTAQNINRAAKLYRQTGQAEETFRERLYEAFDHARRYPSADIHKKRADGRPNRMPLFFTLLAKQLEA